VNNDHKLYMCNISLNIDNTLTVKRLNSAVDLNNPARVASLIVTLNAGDNTSKYD